MKILTSSNISSSSTSVSPWLVAALPLLILDIFEPITGEERNQLGASETLTGEDAPANFLDK